MSDTPETRTRSIPEIVAEASVCLGYLIGRIADDEESRQYALEASAPINAALRLLLITEAPK